jgi:exopolysaccharide biosynthesis polyprenyl glycosylphosphotransferase
MKFFLKVVLLFGDFFLLSGAFLLAYYLRFAHPIFPERPVPPFEIYFNFSFLVALIGSAMLYTSGVYRLKRYALGIEDFFSILRAVTFSSFSIMAMNFALRGIITRYDVETYSRLILLISWAMSLLLLTLWRVAVYALCRSYQKRGRGLKRILIVGTDQVARGFYKAVKKNVDFGYLALGFVNNGTPVRQKSLEGLPVMGNIEDLPDLFRNHPVNEVILACTTLDNDMVAKLIKMCERSDVQFSLIPGFFEILTHQMTVLEIADIPIFRLEERIFQRWGRLVKRAADIAFSGILFLLLSPLLGLISAGIKLDSKGPVLFSHERVGKGEKIFKMYKFRTMFLNAEEKRKDLEVQDKSEDSLLRVSDDPRVTPLGRLLRRFSIDEFPQIFNVIRGEMSLVGPRPHMSSEVAGYREWHKRKYDVLPGITGLTQVSGRKDLSLDEMVRLDIYYIENWSPVLDFKILLQTIPAVLFGKGAY